MSTVMSRIDQFDRLEALDGNVDILIVGGGATGLGTALDAALRGYSVLLVEQDDFASGTSSRSTKLVHGGVRYLKQGQIGLVRESLRERGRLLANAPRNVHKRGFVVPCRSVFDKPFYGMGLAAYDLLAGRFGWGHSRILGKDETLKLLPGLSAEGLLGGVLYWDGQFDDARLALSLARSAIGANAIVLNHAKATHLRREGSKIAGATIEAVCVDASGGFAKRTIEVRARAVVSAVGVFGDEVARMDDPGAASRLTASQGAHIVLDRSFFPGEHSLMVPKTDDGRVLFLIPWENHVLVGTTDTPVQRIDAEPAPLKEEIDYLLDYAGRYLDRKPKRADILSRFAGLRPLVKPSGAVRSTASVSRDHQIFVSESGLITILGGKWTTYRKMAEDVVNQAQVVGGLPSRPCVTAEFRLDEGADTPDDAATGSAKSPVLIDDPHLTEGMVRRMARTEMAETVTDVLARRCRALFLNAGAAQAGAGAVARILGEEKGWSPVTQERERADFQRLAHKYMEPG
jgi:glycerol-3-phosphate dehydrogenase